MNSISTKLNPIFHRLRSMIFDGYINRNAIRGDHDPIKILDTLVPGDFPETLYFPDIDYADDCKSLWDTERHYGRIEQALLADKGKLLHSDKAFREKIIKALRYWVKHDFSNPNWWHNGIGVPRNLADISIAIYEYLPQDIYEDIMKIISRGSIAGEYREKIKRWTGANKIWGVATTVRHAVLIGDESLLSEAIEMAATELNYNFEGIHRDGSFFQHGARLYSGGYGRSFAADISQLIYILQDTEWQFPSENLNVFAVHILDGLRHMTNFKSLDYACVGREFTRPNELSSEKIKKAVMLLADTAEMPRKNEFLDYLAEMNGEKAFKETKYFNEAALLCHHSNGIYIGAKFLTDKLSDAEICNDEGILLYNMSYGTHTCAMSDGSEYFNISPLWDYAKIPGTTAAEETDEEILQHDWCGKTLPNNISGGMQGDECGIIFEKAEHDGITAYVSAFAVPNGMVFLGAGISTEKIQPLHTTVEQSFLQGEICYDGSSVIHHGIRYTPFDGTEFNVKTKETVGSWQRNSLPESPTPVEGKLFTVTVKHPEEKVSCGNKSSYAYAISSASAPAPEIEILQNNEKVQSIRLKNGTSMTIYFDTAKCEIIE